MIQSSLFPGIYQKRPTFIRYFLTQCLTLIAQICSEILAVQCWRTSLAVTSIFALCWCAETPRLGMDNLGASQLCMMSGLKDLDENAFPLLHLHYWKSKREEQKLPRQGRNPFPLAFLINSDFWPKTCSNRHKLLHLQDILIQNTPNSKNFAFKLELGSIF